ncbi:MAG: ATP-binding protein [Treponema sp.]|nr:MAG: ATP-binding protein [Treponema sp.]
MDTNSMIDALQEAMNRRQLSLPARIRPFTTETERLPRAVSLTGPRGVGKTVFLLHHARGRKLLYVSADSPLIAGQSLYAVIRAVFQAGYEGIIVDEVHFARDWSISMKAAYDEYPDRILWISDSSSLILRNGIADLSRRFLDIRMPLMSFREYLFLETGALHPTANPFLQSDVLPVNPDAAVLEAWRAYKQCGTRPFYPEQHFAERLTSILDKTLYFDIPFFVPSITDNNLRLMKAVASTLAQAPIPRLSVNSLCADWAIGSDKLYQLLEVMENVGLLRIVRFEHDRKEKTAGAKLFLADPTFYPAMGGNTGTAREAMTAMCCVSSHWTIEASRDETRGDFVVSRNAADGAHSFTLEVGGAKKNRKGADFAIRDDIDLTSRNALPLWLLAMSW